MRTGNGEPLHATALPSAVISPGTPQRAGFDLYREAGAQAPRVGDRHLGDDVQRARVEHLEQHVVRRHLLVRVVPAVGDDGRKRRAQGDVAAAQTARRAALRGPFGRRRHRAQQVEAVQRRVVLQRHDARGDRARREAVAGLHATAS